MTLQKETYVIIGGGAAGIFAAITAAEHAPQAKVIVLEKTRQLLTKVKISGGGRCNVTHHLFNPKLLIQNYPRGNKELLGPFHQFQAEDTVAWFSKRKVYLKTEEDGRMFPTTDSSETITSCLLSEARRLGVELRLETKPIQIEKKEERFEISLEKEDKILCDKLLLATGSSFQGHEIAQSFGHTIIEPIPSLFTFNVPSSELLDLAGLSVADAIVTIPFASLKQRGPVLVTHFGFSGPAIIKLSAWAAKELYQCDYKAPFTIQWIPDITQEELEKLLKAIKEKTPHKTLKSAFPFPLPSKLLKRLLQLASISEEEKLSRIPHSKLSHLSRLCTCHTFQIEGKTTYKQEFVTCGGVHLKEVDFKRMESKLVKNLFFAGEILDIDGVTGGFNFQNAWTSGWIAGKSMST